MAKLSRRGFLGWTAAAAPLLTPLKALAAPWDGWHTERHEHEYDLFRDHWSHGRIGPGPLQIINRLFNPPPVIQSVEFSNPTPGEVGNLIWYAQEAAHPEREFYVEGSFNSHGYLKDDFKITAHDPLENLDYVCEFHVPSSGEIELRDGYLIKEGESDFITEEDRLAKIATERLRGFIAHINKGAATPQDGKIEYIDLPSQPFLNPALDGARCARILTQSDKGGAPRITTYRIKGDDFCLRTMTPNEPSFTFMGSLKDAQELLKDPQKVRQAISENPQWTASFDAFFETFWDKTKKDERKKNASLFRTLFLGPDGFDYGEVPRPLRKQYERDYSIKKIELEDVLAKEIALALKLAPHIAQNKGCPSPYFLKIDGPQGKDYLRQLHSQQYPQRPQKTTRHDGHPKHER